jgi:hypothetical protein
MKFLSGSQKSPFDEGYKKNLSYAFCHKNHREKNEKYINWRKKVETRI